MANENLSAAAQVAMAKGAAAMCPGCLIQKEVPTNLYGGATHYMPNGSAYECHGEEAWAAVPEFLEQQSPADRPRVQGTPEMTPGHQPDTDESERQS